MYKRISTTSIKQHKDHVLRDPEFLNDADTLRTKFIKKYGKHLEFNVTFLNDEVGIDVNGKDIGRHIFEEVRDVAVEYRIHLMDVINFISSPPKNHFPSTGHEDRATVGTTSVGQVFINIAPSTTLEDIKGIWESKVVPMKRTIYGIGNVKNKPPESSDLIYAVFRQQQKDKTFPQIFEMYETGTLPGFSGSTEQFMTPNDLSKYYKKYEPYIADR